ncbi:hypothetical protein Y032_0456g1779 [Ancylostoma ceylanicum]|uniref:Animal hem peroxidase n=1 Tax=Ancylostoma ceylanicum TaxID=53326 RepID=A0A016WZC2_9BILA|nr:hypothetical protein Y032_0456g1779 [Ancylostoma ceylanicum]
MMTVGAYLLSGAVVRPQLKEFGGGVFNDVPQHGAESAALLIHRSRDHGIPGYVKFREYCTGEKITSFADLKDIVVEPHHLIPILSDLYRSVENVDLLVLALAEKPLRGSLVGPTLGCILASQYRKVIRGDNYWFSNINTVSSFSIAQLKAITSGTKMADIICGSADTADAAVQPNPFLLADEFDNFPISCKSEALSGMSFEEWKQLPTELPRVTPHVAKLLRDAERIVEEKNRQHTKSTDRTDEEDKFPMFPHSLFVHSPTKARDKTTELSEASGIILEATKLLAAERRSHIPSYDKSNKVAVSQFDLDWFFARHFPPDTCFPADLPCDHTAKYRIHSGWCNNLRRPEKGNAFQPFLHLLPPQYDDGIDIPRSTSSTGGRLPNPRVISNVVHHDAFIEHGKYSHMIMQFGQFLGHDITHAPLSTGPNGEALNCSSCDSFRTVSENCLPIPVPEDDPFFSPTVDGEPRCISFIRSVNGQRQLGPRSPMNKLTAFLDGSVIYGSTVCEADALRTNSGGMLRSTQSTINPVSIPPQADDQSQTCQSAPRYPCFTSGDERVSQHPAVTALHSLFHGDHNRIAGELASINSHWDDEILYQEARRIVGATIAHITFNEFLPKLLGNKVVDKYDLRPKSNAYFKGYDEDCDAGLSHSFSAAAYRVGHSMSRRFFSRPDPHFHNSTPPLDLAMNFEYADAVYDEENGGVESIILGLVSSTSMAVDRYITDALRNFLFNIREIPQSGLDLAAINIMRGRDHGLPSYVAHRKLCGLSTPVSFVDLSGDMPPSAVEALSSVYESVEDIDLFSGVVSEIPLKGAMVGPTAACIIAEQFSRLKRCDRFYYENDGPQQFTQDQLDEIRQVTLSSVICSNHGSWIRKVQPDAFAIPDDITNAPTDCDNYHMLDLTKWVDQYGCPISSSMTLAPGESTLISPCTSCTCTYEGLRCRATIIHDCHAAAKKFSAAEMMKDSACAIQCSFLFKKRYD